MQSRYLIARPHVLTLISLCHDCFVIVLCDLGPVLCGLFLHIISAGTTR